MKATIKVPKEITIRHVSINVPVHDDEEVVEKHATQPFPFLKMEAGGEWRWRAMVDVDTGQIANWPAEAGARRFHAYPRDGGEYALYDDTGERLFTLQDYVPHGLIPGSHGDSVELHIDARGIITNWPKKPNVSKFFGADSED